MDNVVVYLQTKTTKLSNCPEVAMNIHVALADARPTVTPAASMRTYVSPSTDTPATLSVWRTDMEAGAAGPLHVIDTEHVVVVTAGVLQAEVAGQEVRVEAGGCVVLPAHSERRLTAGPAGVSTLTVALPGSTAHAGDADPVRVPWAN